MIVYGFETKFYIFNRIQIVYKERNNEKEKKKPFQTMHKNVIDILLVE